MIDVTLKKDVLRTAVVKGVVKMSSSTIKMIKQNKIPKGDVLTIAKVAGIMGAKKTSEIIPYCHPIKITGIDISFIIKKDSIEIIGKVNAVDKTGVEMEALTAVTISALTIYDMCKNVDKEIVIEKIYLERKTKGE